MLNERTRQIFHFRPNAFIFAPHIAQIHWNSLCGCRIIIL